MRFLLAAIALAPTALALALPAAPTNRPFAVLASAIASARASLHASAHHTVAPYAYQNTARASHHTRTHTPTHTKASAPTPAQTLSPAESLRASLQQDVDSKKNDPNCPGGWVVSNDLAGVPMEQCNGWKVTGH